MKVCYIYREKRPTGFSIEEVFANVRSQISSKIEQIDYTINPNKTLLSNIIALRKIKADIYHITGDCHYMGLVLPKSHTILTVHDIRNTKVYACLKGFLYKLLWFWLPLHHLKYITYISHFTKSEIQQSFKLNKGKVIPNPVSRKFRYAEKHILNNPAQVLQIGSSDNKNLDRLIEAVKESEIKLILIRKHNEAIESKLLKYSIPFEWYTNVSDDKLMQLYEQCDIVFFASTYEGFGLPILEAQKVGRPVVTSNLSSMPEVVNDKRVMVNPYSIKEIRDKLEDIISNPELYDDIVQKGLKNCKNFSAKKIAKMYMDFYSEVLDEG